LSCAHRTGCVQGRLILCVTPSTAPGSTSAPCFLAPATCSPLHRASPRPYSLTTRVPVWNATLKAARQSADRNEKRCLMHWRRSHVDRVAKRLRPCSLIGNPNRFTRSSFCLCKEREAKFRHLGFPMTRSVSQLFVGRQNCRISVPLLTMPPHSFCAGARFAGRGRMTLGGPRTPFCARRILGGTLGRKEVAAKSATGKGTTMAETAISIQRIGGRRPRCCVSRRSLEGAGGEPVNGARDGLDLTSYSPNMPLSGRADWRPKNGKPGSVFSVV
jgi:hypothetical protein